jgi:AcrR family transcriptional regulator
MANWSGSVAATSRILDVMGNSVLLEFVPRRPVPGTDPQYRSDTDGCDLWRGPARFRQVGSHTLQYSNMLLYLEVMSSAPQRMTRRESQEATRQRLIESAISLFADHGVAETSLVAVAENAGFSRGAVHGNFSDKEDLAATVVQSIVGELGPELGRALNSTKSSNDRLAEYISTHIAYCRRHPERAAAIIASVGHLARRAPGAASYGERATESVADLVALFEDGQRRGEMRSFDPTTMALTLRSVLDTAVPTYGDIAAEEIVATFEHATRIQETTP